MDELDDLDGPDRRKDGKVGLDLNDPKKSSGVNAKEIAEKKRKDLFFGGSVEDDLDMLEDLDQLGGKDFDNKNEDKFNQVLSTSKENGGLLASIGLRKGEHDESIGDESQEEDPHKKSDLFDTSKDRAAENDKKALDGMQSDEDDFDLGFGSGKKNEDELGGKDDLSPGNESDADIAALSGGLDPQQAKVIHEQFQVIYDKDPELRRALERSDVTKFSAEEKYQILEAYEQGGGAEGLVFEVGDDEDEIDLSMLNEMTEEEKQNLEAQFDKLYTQDPDLQQELGPLSNLTLKTKYQILVHYQRAGESSAMVGTSQGGYQSEETEIIEIDGKRFRRVQIEDKDEEYLMDEDANIYDMQLRKIGQAGDDEDDDEI